MVSADSIVRFLISRQSLKTDGDKLKIPFPANEAKLEFCRKRDFPYLGFIFSVCVFQLTCSMNCHLANQNVITGSLYQFYCKSR